MKKKESDQNDAKMFEEELEESSDSPAYDVDRAENENSNIRENSGNASIIDKAKLFGTSLISKGKKMLWII